MKRKKRRKIRIFRLLFVVWVFGVVLYSFREITTRYIDLPNVALFTQASYPEGEWSSVLINSDHPLDENYAFTLYTLDNGEQIGQLLPLNTVGV